MQPKSTQAVAVSNMPTQQYPADDSDEESPRTAACTSFITAIAENRQAFEIFKSNAKERGLLSGRKPIMAPNEFTNG